MSLIRVTNLTFAYDGSYDSIFEDVSFQIDSSWKLGFIGRNGKGKTTFLNLLLGKYEFKGNIQIQEKLDYFPYQLPEEYLDKFALDAVEKIDPDYELWKICRELTLLETDADILYRPFGTLSYGERTKVMLSVLFSKDNHFLLIDEPTNHLDLSGRYVIKEYLKQKKGYILVSHDRNFMDACVDHVLVLNKNSIQVVKGNFTSWWENKQKQDAFELAENEKLKKEVKKLNESARQASEWADKVESNKIGFHPLKEDRSIGTRSYLGEKSRKMQMRRKNLERRRENAVEDKKKLLKDLEKMDDIKLCPLNYHKEVLLRAKELVLGYNGTVISNNIDFELNRGNRMHIKGINGCGKTTLIKAILGDNITISGSLEVGSGLIISYISQDTSFLKGSLDDYLKEQDLDESLVKALLKKLDFERVQFNKNMEDYSEGQKKKVLIAQSLCTKAHLYIWDEPLNFIDVFSRMQIEKLILKYVPTMIFIEHDMEFGQKIATNIITL